MVTRALAEDRQRETEPLANLELRSPEPVARPFLKWAGGKTQLLGHITARLPIELRSGKIRKYAEPFIGGGAVFFHVAESFDVDAVFLSDINKELILAYRTIRADVGTLIQMLSHMETMYSSLDQEEQSRFYYATRARFNAGISAINHKAFGGDWMERTAQIIFLNRTCYNGLFRVNSRSEFNVPFGRYKNPTICAAKNLRLASRLLQNAEISVGDFESCERFVDANTFVYLDPPYRPISVTSSFTSYSSYDFDEQAQVRLSGFFRQLDARGAKLMLSNSDPKNENPDDNFFDDTYNGFRIERVPASRIINCVAGKRGPLSEVLVRNY